MYLIFALRCSIPNQQICLCNFRHRRTFGTIRNPNVPEKPVSEKPKAKPSNQISLKPPEIAPVPKAEPALKPPQNGSNDRAAVAKKKKSVVFSEKVEGSATKNSPAREVDGVVKTPVRPPFSTKPVRIPGTPYLSAEKCSSCRFDRLETASYWLGQIKSSEFVGKHFVSAAFFRLANDCNAEVFIFILLNSSFVFDCFHLYIIFLIFKRFSYLLFFL